MSRNARRVPGPAGKGDAWLPSSVTGSGVTAMFQTGATRPAEVQTRQMTLPSVTGERVLAAERDAYARGFTDGERKGSATAVAQAQALARRLTHAIADVATLRHETMRRTEREMVRLAIAMAQRILDDAVGADPSRLVDLAQAAVDRAGKTAEATVHLNPADHALLMAPDAGAVDGAEAAAEDVAAAAPGGVKVVADPAVPKGGCLVRSPFGRINAGISTQILEMSRLLLGDDHTTPAAPAGETPSDDTSG